MTKLALPISKALLQLIKRNLLFLCSNLHHLKLSISNWRIKKGWYSNNEIVNVGTYRAHWIAGIGEAALQAVNDGYPVFDIGNSIGITYLKICFQNLFHLK